LKAKNEVLFKCISFKAFVEKQIGYYIKVLCSNCGGKYLSHDFKEFYEKHGIQHQLTQPRTHQQNRMAKHKNQTLMERMQCMVLANNSPKFPWAKNTQHYHLFVNRSMIRVNSKVILKEKLRCIQPNLSNLRIFGCDVTCISQMRIEKN
jgi:hypothetical protein